VDSLRSRGLLASRFRKHLAWARQLTHHFKGPSRRWSEQAYVSRIIPGNAPKVVD